MAEESYLGENFASPSVALLPTKEKNFASPSVALLPTKEKIVTPITRIARHSINNVNEVKPLRVVTAVMVLFSCLTYFKEFSELKFNIQVQNVEVNALSSRDDGTGQDLSTRNGEKAEERSLRQNGRLLKEIKYTSSQYSQERSPPFSGRDQTFIPLPELVRADEEVVCPEGLLPVPIVVNETADLGFGRKIPRIIHQTGEGKCFTQPFYDNSKAWAFEGYSYYFHDAEARQRLLQKYWPMFPQLQNSFECLKNAGGAAVADLWRYLALWEYGGVYADMDDAPQKLFNASTLTPDIDAFFLVERIGILSQYFFAVSPKHPLMFLAIHDVMEQMHLLEDTGTFYVPGTTGPRCIKRAFLKFMGLKSDAKGSLLYQMERPVAGTYQGVINGNRSVTVVANRTTQDLWVHRSAINRNRKRNGWEAMNFTNYHHMNKVPTNKTCLQLILEKHQSENEIMQELHRIRW